MLDQYVARWWDEYPGVVLHYREGDERVLVGVQTMGPESAIHFVSREEGERHVRAIWTSAVERTVPAIEARWADRAEQLIALLPVDPAKARAEASRQATLQIAGYLADVRQIMADRRALIADPDPDLVRTAAETVIPRPPALFGHNGGPRMEAA